MSTSGSDAEFFDAAEDIGSPRTPKNSISYEVHVVESDGAKKNETVPELVILPSTPSEETQNDGNNEEKEKPSQIPVCVEETVIIEEISITQDMKQNTKEDVKVELNIIISETEKKVASNEEIIPDVSSQPDIVACVQERPTHLPGVHPVDVIKHQEAGAPSISGGDNVQIRKMPPPRPPRPPKRPPPPAKYLIAKAGHPGKPYLSAVDDGLLTPTSTVDNLTREFTEALKQVQKDETSTRENEFRRTKASSLNRTSSAKESTKTDSLNYTKVQRHSSSSSLGKRGDEEILECVIVKNLDTGESMPLSAAAVQVSQCLNPLALQIMSRTKEFSYAGSSNSSHESQPTGSLPGVRTSIVDSDSLSIASDDIEIGKEVPTHKTQDGTQKLKHKSRRFKKIVGKKMSKVKVVAGSKMEKAVQKAKHMKDEVMHQETLNVSSDEDSTDPSSASAIKVKASSSNKGPYQFSHLKQVQDIAVHVGAVWCMKFSHCGRLLATAGQDNVIWVWVLRDFYNYFNEMRNKYDNKDELFGSTQRQSMHQSNMDFFQPNSTDEVFDFETQSVNSRMEEEEDDAPFRQVPFSSYVGHSADVLDLAWSKNFFILSSSMDKTVRLWHISRKECLCCFQHIDFVTAIAFHPRDDRYFLSGSLDSKLRLWNIPDKKVALWNEVAPDGSSSSSSSGGPAAGGALITTVNFCENGKFAVCGTYDGRCIFFDTEHLKYHTQIHVRSSRGRNNKGHKITGIEPLSGEHKILVTSNDSRVRLYDLRDLSLACKYKGHTNLSSQIKASFSPDSKYIICGSEDKCVYIWKTSLPQDVMKMSSFRRDRNDSWECMKAHDAVVTCAVFAPQPQLLYKSNSENGTRDVQRPSKSLSILSLTSKKQTSDETNVVISADFNGGIKIIVCVQ